MISLVFYGETVPYTRQNTNTRWRPGYESSQEARYERWKASIRQQFVEKGYDKLEGVPFFEPLAFGARFFVSKMFTEKDLSNCVKAIEDALNPDYRVTKKYTVFNRFLYDDDKQIRVYLKNTGIYSCRKGDDRIEVEVEPLWERDDCMISYLRGIPVDVDVDQGFATVMTRSDYGFNVLLPNRVLKSIDLSMNESERPLFVLYIYPHAYGEGSITFSFYGFQTKEELRVFKDILTVEKVGCSKAFKFFEFSLTEMLAAIADGDKQFFTRVKGIGPTTVEKVIEKLKKKAYIPVVSDGRFDEKKAEQLIGSIVQLWNQSVTQVRRWVSDQKFDYSLSFQELFKVASAKMMADRKERRI
jgi:Holliday junction resolvasome RuvABC DNA-binding subunit